MGSSDPPGFLSSGFLQLGKKRKQNMNKNVMFPQAVNMFKKIRK